MDWIEAHPVPESAMMSWEELHMGHPLRRPPAARWKQLAIAILIGLMSGTAPVQDAKAASAPDFSLELLDGNTTSLLAHRGKPVLVNFFHSR